MNVHIKSAGVRSKKIQEPPSLLQIQYWSSPNLQEVHNSVEMKTEKQTMNKIKQETCNSHSATDSSKAEKSLKLPSNVNKSSSDKRKKIHWYTFDIRQNPQ